MTQRAGALPEERDRERSRPDRSAADRPAPPGRRAASVGCYVLDTEDGPALFDCGPTTTIDTLKAGLAQHGLRLTDIRHLLLSHIHLDHAGAAGMLVREHPALQVHVSAIGAPHLVEPERLERSARRLYGERSTRSGASSHPCRRQNVHVVGDTSSASQCFPTPGHASHHVCYLDRDGTLYAGDAAGVRIQPGRFVMPPTPPPEFDSTVWQQTIDEIERARPGAARAHPLRRRRRRPAPSRRAAARAVDWADSSAAAPSRRSSSRT